MLRSGHLCSVVRQNRSEAFKEYIEEHTQTYPVGNFSPPTKHEIKQFLNKSTDSGVGEDGLPYSAWRFAGEFAIDTLYESSLWLAIGNKMLISYNAAIQVFLAKGEKEDDSPLSVFRSVDELRVIGFQSTDTKTVAGSAAFIIKNSFSQKAVAIQRGFAHARNFGRNIIELDSAARTQSMLADACDHPSLLGTDFGLAFPSVLHDWLESCFCFSLQHGRV